MGIFSGKRDVPVRHSTGVTNTPSRDWFEDFFNQMTNFRSDLFPTHATTQLSNFNPAFNITETNDAYQFEAEIPGVKRDEIDVEIKDQTLIVKGEKTSFNEEKKKDYHLIERSNGSFYRSFRLPSDIDSEKIKAELDHGVLMIQVGKTANTTEKVKKVSIS